MFTNYIYSGIFYKHLMKEKILEWMTLSHVEEPMNEQSNQNKSLDFFYTLSFCTGLQVHLWSYLLSFKQ